MYGKKEYLSYPFLYESKNVVMFELLTDELSSYLGLAASLALDKEFKTELIYLNELVYHLNPCVRKKTKLEDSEITWLYERYNHYQDVTKDREALFVLPTGNQLASVLHICRTKAKMIVRLMHSLVVKGVNISPELFDFVNILANYLFTAAMYANKFDDTPEIPFISRVY